MASIISDDENFDDSLSDFSQCSIPWDDNISEDIKYEFPKTSQAGKVRNIVNNIINRQTYGRFAKNPRAKTEKLFNNVHAKCRYALSSLLKGHDALNHIFMGFTLCGQYFISFTEKIYEDLGPFSFLTSYEYELHIWRFIPGEPLKFVSKHKIFKLLKGLEVLDKIIFMQFPDDPFKLICYGLAAANPAMAYITILTLPAPKRCKHCQGNIFRNNDSVNLGWCAKHGFILHYMFSISQPCPQFDPKISLAYPDHLVINTGHYIHILHVNTLQPLQSTINLSSEDNKLLAQTTFNDDMSEVSESPSEHFGSNSVVDAILEDFNEYDLEGSECNKPFHELNISCEPLNVTGKSYHNTLVQNIVDPRLKRLQNSTKDYLFSVPQTSNVQKTVEKTKIDKKIAEKAYEFIEENEKCEKLSLFRKKRLAEKKYEFSEDNSENIVPFNSLRRERRFLCRSQTRCIRSPDFNSLFLSPRSSGRSPMQSPNSRNGQFSPNGARNVYCTSIRNSPHSKSPISPKEAARKFYVYSPSLDSDCSDSDSRLILRSSTNYSTSQLAENRFNHNGLLIVDPKVEKPRWIKKLVRRYSNGDFENGSLVSGQSRDDYNIPIEIPLLVQTLTEQHLDVVPDFKVDQVTEMQLIVTQRTLDCEQFVQKRAQKLCLDAQLEFLHCEDYDIKIVYVCPIDGHIICQAVIKIGALKSIGSCGKPESFSTQFLFSWNIITDNFEVIEISDPSYCRLQPSKGFKLSMTKLELPTTNCKEVLVMNYCSASKASLRDYHNVYEVCLGMPNQGVIRHSRYIIEESDPYSFSDSD